MSIQVENIDTSTRTAVGELLLRANSNQLVKRVLTAFDPFASKTVQIRALASFKLDSLEACAEFLNIPLADSEDNKIFTKETLQSRILLAIKALLPATCSECSQLYRNQLDAEEQSPLFCYMCFQGAHDCAPSKTKNDAMLEHSITLPAGMVWLCHDCHKNSNPVIPRRSRLRHTSNSGTTTPANSRAPSPSPQPTIAEHLSDSQDNILPPICDKYRTGKCPHGLRGNKLVDGHKCPKSHPKRCIKFCKNGKNGRYGCSKGENCKYYHPVLCKFSLRNRICTNKECTFVHLKGTKREQPLPDQEPSRAINNASRQMPRPTEPNVAQHSTNHDLGINSNHFLELKSVVELMSKNLQQQQQDLASLRSNILQVQQFHIPHLPPMNQTPQPFMSNPLQPQNPAYPQMIQPTMPFIHQSSC